MKKLIGFISILLLATFVVYILLYQRGTNKVNRALVVVHSSQMESRQSAAESRNTLAAISKSKNISITEIENQIADSILRTRAIARKASGGFGPGVFIIDGNNSSTLDPNKIRIVPIGGVLDFKKKFGESEGFVKAHHFDKENGLYLRSIDVNDTNLKMANFDGYHLEGNFLRGEEYATTERLKNLERTPSGRHGWTGLLRMYSNHPDLGDVVLREIDNVAAGITVRVPKNSINSSVNGNPAMLTRLQDGSGRAMAAVQWSEPDGRTNSLYISKIDAASVSSMMQLAESLAHASRNN